jgi:hypothetical protein
MMLHHTKIDVFGSTPKVIARVTCIHTPYHLPLGWFA